MDNLQIKKKNNENPNQNKQQKPNQFNLQLKQLP